MHVMTLFWERLFFLLLVFGGLTGLLALASPTAFALVANYGGRWVGPKQTKTAYTLDKRFDIDEYVLGHSRLFGLLVSVSVGYLWWLSTHGPDAFSKSFVLILLTLSVGMGAASLIGMTKQKRQIERHQSEAHTDPLTSLANRRAFDMELSRRLAQRQCQGTPLSLMIIDIDLFKECNDTYGHQAGDMVLAGLADALTATIGQTDVIARLGGDEFSAILSGRTLPEASLTAERLRTTVAGRLFTFEGKDVQVTISLGLAEALPEDDSASLIKRADSALYAAKDAGRNRSYRQSSPEPADPTSCI